MRNVDVIKNLPSPEQMKNWTAKETPVEAQRKADEAFNKAKTYSDNTKVPLTPGKQLTDENYSLEEKTKLAGLNNYIHPAKHTVDEIATTSDAQFVSEAQIKDWTDKETITGSRSKAKKAYEDAIAYSNERTGELNNKKLDFAEVQLDKLLLKANGELKYTIQLPKEGKPYILAPATSELLGGVKIGNGLNITEDGIISLDKSIVTGEITWEKITGKPEKFIPDTHTHTKSDISDMTFITNLESSDNNNPLAASQGKALAELIKKSGHTHDNKVVLDDISLETIAFWNNKAEGKHNHTKADISDLKDFSVINNLTSQDINSALSANQGKVLDEKINATLTQAKEHAELKDIETLKNAKAFTTEEAAKKSDIIHKHKISDIEDFIIENNLTSESITNALSATQGKILDSKVTNLNTEITKITPRINGLDERISTLENKPAQSFENKDVLVKITQSKFDYWDNKSDSTHEHNADEIIDGNIHHFVSTEEKNKIKNVPLIEDDKTELTSTWSSKNIQDKMNSYGISEAPYKSFIVSNFVKEESSSLYKAVINHMMNSSDLMVFAYNNSTKRSELLSYKIINDNSIEITSEDTNPIEVKILGAAVKQVEAKSEINDLIESELTTWSSSKIRSIIGEGIRLIDEKVNNAGSLV